MALERQAAQNGCCYHGIQVPRRLGDSAAGNSWWPTRVGQVSATFLGCLTQTERSAALAQLASHLKEIVKLSSGAGVDPAPRTTRFRTVRDDLNTEAVISFSVGDRRVPAAQARRKT